MRRLASDLGVSPMACYWHVSNKEELLVLLADHILSQVPSPEGNRARWAEDLEVLAHQICDALSQAPGLATWVLNQNPLLITPASLRLADAATSLLLNAGFDARSAAAAFAALYIYVTGQVHLRERPKAAPDASASMLSGEYPTLIKIAEFLGDFGNGGLFDYGLARLLEGFQQDLARMRRARPATDRARPPATTAPRRSRSRRT